MSTHWQRGAAAEMFVEMFQRLSPPAHFNESCLQTTESAQAVFIVAVKQVILMETILHRLQRAFDIRKMNMRIL